MQKPTTCILQILIILHSHIPRGDAGGLSREYVLYKKNAETYYLYSTNTHNSIFTYPQWGRRGLSREYILRIPSVSYIWRNAAAFFSLIFMS